MKMQLKQAHLEMHQYKWQHAKGQCDNRLYLVSFFE